MGLVVNIDEALRNNERYNVLGLPLNRMMQDQQEAWEKGRNPIDMLFHRNTMKTFQETYSSSIGFDHAFAETSDMNIGPLHNTEDGFTATYRTRTFQGGFMITQQAIEDRQYGQIKDEATSFGKRWRGDLVEYALTAISGGFGKAVTWGSEKNGGISTIKLQSADTVDGELDGAKNPLFTNKHNIVKRRGMTDTELKNAAQSNLFYAEIDVEGSDQGKIAKLADIINLAVTEMENYKDDNNKRAGVNGDKTIVCGNDPHLIAALNAAVDTPMLNTLGQNAGTNPGYKRATIESTPYLLDIPQCAGGRGFFIVDSSYNAANHGPEFTERVPFTLDVNELKRPKCWAYDGRQRFDINVASWRGIAYVYLGTPAGESGEWDDVSHFTKLEPIATISTPVEITGTVTTKTEGAGA